MAAEKKTGHVYTLGLSSAEISAFVRERDERVWQAKEGGEPLSAIAKREQITRGRAWQICRKLDKSARTDGAGTRL